MLLRLGIVMAVVALALAPGGASVAAASPRDVSATHAYLVAGYAALHKVVGTWHSVQSAIQRLDRRFLSECPHVGVGSPQSEEEQKLAYEVAGALWATAYHADAGVVRAFVRAVKPLRWSNPATTRAAHKFVTGLTEMAVLRVPDLCGDVRAWSAGGYGAVSAATAQFVRHVEAIDVKEVPRRLLIAYVQPSDRGLLARAERLNTRFEELEFVVGQSDWDALLEVLSLNQ